MNRTSLLLQAMMKDSLLVDDSLTGSMKEEIEIVFQFVKNEISTIEFMKHFTSEELFHNKYLLTWEFLPHEFVYEVLLEYTKKTNDDDGDTTTQPILPFIYTYVEKNIFHIDEVIEDWEQYLEFMNRWNHELSSLLSLLPKYIRQRIHPSKWKLGTEVQSRRPTPTTKSELQTLIRSYIKEPASFSSTPPSVWDVSRITDMSHLVEEQEHKIPKDIQFDIGSWDVSNVMNMESMFSCFQVEDGDDDCNPFESWFQNPRIGDWDVSKVTNMKCMFNGAFLFNQPIGDWDVSNVTNMQSMFRTFQDEDSFNQPIGDWDVSNVTNMNRMFEDARTFNQHIGKWNVSNVTNMEYMFSGACAFNQPLGTWNVSNVTNMKNMFCDARAFNQSIGTWNVSNVTNMKCMFTRAFSFNQPIDDWDVSNITNMERMFSEAREFASANSLATAKASAVSSAANAERDSGEKPEASRLTLCRKSMCMPNVMYPAIPVGYNWHCRIKRSPPSSATRLQTDFGSRILDKHPGINLP